MHKQSSLFAIVLWLLCVASAHGDVWNRLVLLQPTITPHDDTTSSHNNNNNNSQYDSLMIELFSNRTFQLLLQIPAQTHPLTFQGKLRQNHDFSINSHAYNLQNSQLSGTVQYQINKGLKWSYSITIDKPSITIVGEDVTSSYINQLALLVFGIVGVVMLPLSDSVRNKMLYNIRKRTHLLFSYLILLKLTLVVSCFMLNCYYFVINSPWYYIFLTYGVYLFMISPSIVHAMYFITSIQRQLKESEWFKQNSTTLKCLIMSFVILSIPGLTAVLLFVQKGIIFLYVCSAATVYQYLQACRSKRYSFGRVLMYDVLITAILSLFCYFMPSLGFTLTTLKQQLLFWNYYLGMFIFGIVLSRIIIKGELAEQIYLEQNNDSVPVQADSQRRHQLPPMHTHQVLQS